MRFFRHLFKKFSYAFRGMGRAFRTDNSFKYHFAFSVLVVVLGFVFNLSILEWVEITFAIGLVVISELFNTAIEYLVRILIKEHHQEAGLLLDISAGAVLFAALVALVIGLIIFGPRVVKFVSDLFG
jgi:diacylglycerol kinase